LAKRLNVSRPVISKAVSDSQPSPSEAILAAWAGATGAPLDRLNELAERARSGVPDWFVPWLAPESNATLLRYWSPFIVPGIAQTKAYGELGIATGGEGTTISMPALQDITSTEPKMVSKALVAWERLLT
jgi:transcriptional regulator with XRE-family HTH domain